MRPAVLYGLVALAILATGVFQSWSLALTVLNLGLISAIMALGVNIQWGYAGLFNVGVMGFAALGGVAAVLVSQPPVPEAWAAGGLGVLVAGALTAATVAAILVVRTRVTRSLGVTLALGVLGYVLIRQVYDPAVAAIEAVNPSSTGYLGGLGLPILLSWPVGGALAAAAAWLIGRIALGLRADYLAIATLGISEIVIFMIKNEDWLTRGVKDVSGLDRPVPQEIELQASDGFLALADRLGGDPVALSSIAVKLAYAAMFAVVLAAIWWLANRALASPWGRTMRAIRDNEDAAAAMGKDVTRRHRQVFILGCAVIGIAGAMLVTLDGQFTPGTYTPLRFTFLIWVMVIVGGSGNNAGAVLGGFLIWFLWVNAEPAGQALAAWVAGLAPDTALAQHLTDNASHLRMVFMGTILIVTLRVAPRGLIPER